MTAAVFSIGAHHADEIYQIFEFAGYKLGLNSAQSLPWEFHEQMRSGVQPLIVYGLTKFLGVLGLENPFIIATVIRLIHGLLGFSAGLQLTRLLEKQFFLKTYRAAFWYFNLLFWLLPYFHVRFSSESFSSLLFISAFLMLGENGKQTNLFRFLLAGLLCGFAFHVRFQISFMIAGYFFWLLLIERQSLKNSSGFIAGVLLAVGSGLLVDQWLYGEWTLSWWNYLEQNLFENKASQFGTEPVYYFFTEALVQLIPPFSVIMIACLLLFWIKFPKHVMTWITLPFFLFHLPVAHKEIRFLMPLLVFLPFMTVYYLQSVREEDYRILKWLQASWFTRFSLLFNACALVFICFKPADSSTQRLEKIYAYAEGDSAVVLFDKDNPYELGSLNYFHKASVRTDYIPADMRGLQSNSLYLFSEADAQPEIKILGTRVFYRLYCNFPTWFNYLNFNGWVERAGRYSIYKCQTS